VTNGGHTFRKRGWILTRPAERFSKKKEWTRQKLGTFGGTWDKRKMNSKRIGWGGRRGEALSHLETGARHKNLHNSQMRLRVDKRRQEGSARVDRGSRPNKKGDNSVSYWGGGEGQRSATAKT